MWDQLYSEGSSKEKTANGGGGVDLNVNHREVTQGYRRRDEQYPCKHEFNYTKI